jgi:hypothetical protein
MDEPTLRRELLLRDGESPRELIDRADGELLAIRRRRRSQPALRSVR